jgi:hypothetical protein
VSELHIGDRVRIVGDGTKRKGGLGLIIGEYSPSVYDVRMLDGSLPPCQSCLVCEEDLSRLESTKALQAVLLYFAAPFWGEVHRAKWHELTGSDKASRETLLRLVRETLTDAEVAAIEGG